MTRVSKIIGWRLWRNVAKQRTRKMAAFTLFEALVALAVFSFAVMGFLMAFDSTLDAARVVRRESLIRQVMEDRMAWLENAELAPMDSRIDGPWPGMKVQEIVTREVLTDDKKNVLDGFWKMRVVVEWTRDGQEEKMEASFLRYGL